MKSPDVFGLQRTRFINMTWHIVTSEVVYVTQDGQHRIVIFIINLYILSVKDT